jgi:energy-coupling factor transporter transmembrane protein EcfT
MSPIRNQLVTVIDNLPEQEQFLLLEIAKRFISDDVATQDDILAIQAARKEYKNGETVSHNSINWD